MKNDSTQNEILFETQQKINKPDKYAISYTSKALNMKEYSLRYFEKAIGYEIERDENNNRWYTQTDIDQLQYHLGQKSIGYTYPQIRKMREVKGQKVSDEQSELDENIESEIAVTTQNQAMQMFLETLEEMKKSMSKLEKLDQIEKGMLELKKQNAKLLIANDENMKREEERDIRLVEKLRQVTEEKKKKKGFLGLLGVKTK